MLNPLDRHDAITGKASVLVNVPEDIVGLWKLVGPLSLRRADHLQELLQQFVLPILAVAAIFILRDINKRGSEV